MQNKIWKDYKAFYNTKGCWNDDDIPTTLEQFISEWRFVRNVKARSLEETYHYCQGFYWSPNGEANDLIRKLGVKHTSMSISDIIMTAEGELYSVQGVGFKKLNIKVKVEA